MVHVKDKHPFSDISTFHLSFVTTQNTLLLYCSLVVAYKTTSPRALCFGPES